jgi:hypothetical protein
MEKTGRANEIAEMALSFYAGDELLTNRTLSGKVIDVSIKDYEAHCLLA